MKVIKDKNMGAPATRRIVFFTALGVLVVVFVLNNPILFGFCQSISTYGTGTKYCNYASLEVPEVFSLLGFYLSVSLIFFSLLTYKLPDEVFRAWWRFARWFMPAAVILTLLTPNDRGGGWGIPNLLDPEFVGIVFALFFAALSLCIVAWKIIVVYYLKKKCRTGK